jgi:hypothetical protein
MSKRERDLIVDKNVTQLPRLLRGLGSSGIQAGAALWKWEVLEASIRVQGSVERVAKIVEKSMGRIGIPKRDDEGLMTVVGTGWRNLNQAVVTVSPGSANGAEGVTLQVRSVSGEGLIEQHGAVTAFDRLVADLRREATVTIDSVSTSMQGRSGGAPAKVRLRVAMAFVVILLWIGAVLVGVLAGDSLSWLVAALFFVGLALAFASNMLLWRTRDRGHTGA